MRGFLRQGEHNLRCSVESYRSQRLARSPAIRRLRQTFLSLWLLRASSGRRFSSGREREIHTGTSQAPPMAAEVTARAPNQMYQGTDGGLSPNRVILTAPAGFRGKDEVDMKPRTVWAILILLSRSLRPASAWRNVSARPGWRRRGDAFRSVGSALSDDSWRAVAAARRPHHGVELTLRRLRFQGEADGLPGPQAPALPG